MNITVAVEGIEGIKHYLNGKAARIKEELFTLMQDTGLAIKAAARAAAPRGVTGNLRGRIGMRASQAKMGVVVKSAAPHTWLVEHGRSPGRMPPLTVRREGWGITPWAEAKGVDPFLIARAIGRKGTRAQPFITPAAERYLPGFEPQARALVEQILTTE